MPFAGLRRMVRRVCGGRVIACRHKRVTYRAESNQAYSDQDNWIVHPDGLLHDDGAATVLAMRVAAGRTQFVVSGWVEAAGLLAYPRICRLTSRVVPVVHTRWQVAVADAGHPEALCMRMHRKR